VQVAKENGSTLPNAGLFIIRYHSFYRKYFYYHVKTYLILCTENLITENLDDLAALHKEGAYTHLMNEEDFENLKWLHIFKYVCILVCNIFFIHFAHIFCFS